MDNLREKIENAETLSEMNDLRDELVSKMSEGSKEAGELLEEWQDKYWDMKTCDEGHVHGGTEPSHPLKG